MSHETKEYEVANFYGQVANFHGPQEIDSKLLFIHLHQGFIYINPCLHGAKSG
jgi:hypothetical protein